MTGAELLSLVRFLARVENASISTIGFITCKNRYGDEAIILYTPSVPTTLTPSSGFTIYLSLLFGVPGIMAEYEMPSRVGWQLMLTSICTR